MLINVQYMHSPYPGGRKEVVDKGEEEKKKIKYLMLPCMRIKYTYAALW